MSDPLPNSDEARTVDGTLLNQAPEPTALEKLKASEKGTTIPPTTAATELKEPETTLAKPTEAKAELKVDAKPEEKSLLNKDAKAGAPEKYEEFKVPEGFALDAAVATEASALFKEFNLPQAAAQKLVDFYIAKTTEAHEAPMKVWADYNKQAQAELLADPAIGGKLDEVKTTISRALDNLGQPALVTEFKEFLDYSGAGNNLAFAKVLYSFAQRLAEGTHVAGNGPSKFGQVAPGSVTGPGSKAMYPNNP